MARIFISYRRDDAAGHAGRIYDHLREEFGEEHVFMDVDAIEPGVDFVERIESAVATVDVFLAVLGRSWATVVDDEGRRRLDDPQDHVRREVAAALRRRITVIPVLVGGAAMPKAQDLPEELVPLRRRNALPLSDLDWHSGARRLVEAIERALGADERRPPHRDEGPSRPDQPEEPGRLEPRASPLPLLAGLAGAALLVAATALRWDALARPDFGGGTVPGLGLVVAPASLAIAAGAVYALLRAWRGGAGATEVGLLLGFGVAGAAKHAALLGRFATTEQRADQWGSGTSLALGLAGSLVLAGVAAAWLGRRHLREARFAAVPGRVFATLGAIGLAVGTAIPFNVSFPRSRPAEQVILARDLWEALDPLALALAVVLTVVLAGRADRLAVSGVLIALGLAAALLWLRYVGVPLLQMLDRDDLASPRVGGFVGLAGALLVWRAGIVAGRSAVRAGEAGSPASATRP